MNEISVNFKIKHFTTSSNKLKQHIGVFSYNDYFLQDTCSFYRNLRVFIRKFYLPYKILYISPGLNQYYIEYDITSISPEYNDIDEIFTFAIPDKEERICNYCEYYHKTHCKYHDKEIKEIPEYCFFWSEK